MVGHIPSNGREAYPVPSAQLLSGIPRRWYPIFHFIRWFYPHPTQWWEWKEVNPVLWLLRSVLLFPWHLCGCGMELYQPTVLRQILPRVRCGTSIVDYTSHNVKVLINAKPRLILVLSPAMVHLWVLCLLGQWLVAQYGIHILECISNSGGKMIKMRMWRRWSIVPPAVRVGFFHILLLRLPSLIHGLWK